MKSNNAIPAVRLLTYKGEQVILYIKDTRADRYTLRHEPEKSRRFHVAECETLETMRKMGRFERYVVTNRMSHETIYRSLFIQTRGVLKKELLAHLRATRAIRRSRHASLKRDGLGQIKDAISIRERPATVEDRAIPGHWEGDLIAGARNSFIATLVERHTRYVMLAKVMNKDTAGVVAALTKQVQHLPRELRRSLTWDRGKEMADHKRLTLATDLDVYFCDPHSPWQRGTNENTNRLLRQYFPKGTDLSVHSQTKLNAVARELNERPRKTLNCYSPAEKFDECVATIG